MLFNLFVPSWYYHVPLLFCRKLLQISNAATLELSRWRTKKSSVLGHSQRQRDRMVQWKTDRTAPNQWEKGAKWLETSINCYRTTFQMFPFSSKDISIFTFREYFDFWSCVTEVFTWHLITIVHICEAQAPVFSMKSLLYYGPTYSRCAPSPSLCNLCESSDAPSETLCSSLIKPQRVSAVLPDTLIKQLQQAAASFSPPTSLLCF